MARGLSWALVGALALPAAAASSGRSTLEAARELAAKERFAEAAKLLEPSAEEGDADAQVLLGDVYFQWEEVTPPLKGPPGIEKAVFWYFRAADQGSPAGQLGLARYYGAYPGDRAREVAWARKAADAGDLQGLHWVANAYAAGRGVEPDLAKAAELFRRAAERGFPPSMLRLALACEEGKGLARDPAQAYMWALLASRGGAAAAPGAEALAAGLSRRLKPEELAEGRKRADGWKAAKDETGAGKPP